MAVGAETSDIVLVVILDRVYPEDIRTYDKMLDGLPERQLICGFFGGNNMFKYDFSYDNILTPDEVKKKGILFDDERFSFESYWENGFNHYERLFYSNNGDEKAPFSGLLYELYPNGNVHGYSYYNGGYQEGEDVDFYDNGVISEYTNYNKTDSTALIINWFRNGTISEIMEISDHGRHKKYIEYDENGKIITQGES